jgi:hypothetical protein
LNEKETKENNIHGLQISVNQATFENDMAEGYLNIDANTETEVTTEETDKFIENHQQACSKNKKEDEKKRKRKRKQEKENRKKRKWEKKEK